eukprot:GHVS01006972.1.p1 GENE.GHVS01006972.1~~GHVS01006972.1.p1  ORF type:complete len:478 (-),score=74.74 GHVS01006972.1:382-1815(-)
MYSAAENVACVSDATRLKSSSSSLYKVHHQLVCHQHPNCNIAFSPHNLDTGVAMLYLGAAGSSAAQMKDSFYGQRDPADVVKDLRLKELCMTQSSSTQEEEKDEQGFPDLCGAARTIVDQSVSFEAYAARLLKDFDSTAESADFQGAPEREREKINKWVEKQTRSKISGLLPPGSITSMSRLVLVATLYFKSHWKKPFTFLTDCGEFHGLTVEENGGLSVVAQTGVRYMELTRAAFVGCYRYDDPTIGAVPVIHGQQQLTSGLGCQLVEVPYKGDDISMVIVMPDDPLQLPAYEKKWANTDQVEQWVQELRSEESTHRRGDLTVVLPYFAVTPETTPTSMDIEKVLKKLGVTDIFNQQTCDLSNIATSTTTSTTGKDKLFVSGIFHRCSVEVDEKGTEASAATAVVAATMCMPPLATTVRVDRPFLFQIRKKPNNALDKTAADLVLFMGRVADIKALQPLETSSAKMLSELRVLPTG